MDSFADLRLPARARFFICSGRGETRSCSSCQSHNPALLLLETMLPGLDTFAAAEDVRSVRPGAKIGILTCHNQLALLARTRRSRLHGFILKRDGFDELNYAIRTMLKGGFYTPPSMSSTLVEPVVVDDPVESLTEREKSVFSLYAQGYGNQQIANTLHISVKTSETHVNNLRRKLPLWLGIAPRSYSHE